MFEYVVGLEVIDEEIYSEYRKYMMPILKTYKGGFGYDFKIDRILKTQAETPINRLFTIHFPNKQISDDFFSDSEYLKIKKNFFEKSVKICRTKRH